MTDEETPLIFCRLGEVKEDMPYDGSFPCPKNACEQVDEAYCTTFCEGKGCKFMQDCPSFQLNCRMPEVKK